jgi:type I restriction enzyme, S subunit
MTMQWPMVPLSEVLTRHDDWIPIEPEAQYRQITARLWGQGLTLRGVVLGAEIAATYQNRVRSGQFLISKIDARHGAFGLVTSDLDGAIVSNDFPSFNVSSTRALPAFVQWVSKTDWFVGLCKRASEGSTNRVRLREGAFLAQQIPLPSIEMQMRIVARLDAVEARLGKRRSETDAVELELATLLTAAFRRIANDAPRARMVDVAPLVRRSVIIDPQESYTEIGVRSFFKGAFHRRTVGGAEFTWQKLFRINEGDLIFSNLMAWEKGIALAGVADDGCVGNHRMLTCEADRSRVEPGFLWFYFTTDEGFSQVVAASPGTIARNKTLTADELSKITVPVPSLDAQRWFDALRQKACAAREVQAAAAAELDHLMPALLAEAFAP